MTREEKAIADLAKMNVHLKEKAHQLKIRHEEILKRQETLLQHCRALLDKYIIY